VDDQETDIEARDALVRAVLAFQDQLKKTQQEKEWDN